MEEATCMRWSLYYKFFISRIYRDLLDVMTLPVEMTLAGEHPFVC